VAKECTSHNFWEEEDGWSLQLTQESLRVRKLENYDLMQGPVHLPKLPILLAIYWPAALIGPNRPPWGEALPQWATQWMAIRLNFPSGFWWCYSHHLKVSDKKVSWYDWRWSMYTCACILPKLPALVSRFFYFLTSEPASFPVLAVPNFLVGTWIEYPVQDLVKAFKDLYNHLMTTSLSVISKSGRGGLSSS
jgi:hypothetical protein